MNLKYSLKPSGDFWNLLLEDFNSGRCLVVFTFSDLETAEYSLETAESYLEVLETLEDDFSGCDSIKSATEHLYFCYGFLYALLNFLAFTSAERYFLVDYFNSIYKKRIGEIKNETCE